MFQRRNSQRFLADIDPETKTQPRLKFTKTMRDDRKQGVCVCVSVRTDVEKTFGGGKTYGMECGGKKGTGEKGKKLRKTGLKENSEGNMDSRGGKLEDGQVRREACVEILEAGDLKGRRKGV